MVTGITFKTQSQVIVDIHNGIANLTTQPDQWCDRQQIQNSTGRDPITLHKYLKVLREQGHVRWKRRDGRGQPFVYRPIWE
jgi:hypothetical protein